MSHIEGFDYRLIYDDSTDRFKLVRSAVGINAIEGEVAETVFSCEDKLIIRLLLIKLSEKKEF